jgi:IS6 family transposase
VRDLLWTYVKAAGQWRYVYRAIDQFGQVIDVVPVLTGGILRRLAGSSNGLPGPRTSRRSRWSPTGRRSTRSCSTSWSRGPGSSEQYANDRIEADHDQLKRWLRALRGASAPGTAEEGGALVFVRRLTTTPPAGMRGVASRRGA